MKSMLLFLGLAAALTGCTRTTGARALYPLIDEDQESVWIYLESNKSSRTGVYRCTERGGNPRCIQAPLVRE